MLKNLAGAIAGAALAAWTGAAAAQTSIVIGYGACLNNRVFEETIQYSVAALLS